jgi:uncharacterized repeat protein (TIGR03803 family)
MLRHLTLALGGVLVVCLTGAYAHAQTFTTLHTFESTDGANPEAALVQDSAGNLYSTTVYGGNYQSGTAFKLAPSGALTVLHHFGYPSTDGSVPSGPLLPVGQGNFYATTYTGGIYACGNFDENQCGTVFQVNASGKESVVYSFGTNANDGSNPTGGLIRGADGNLYGTTGFGGATYDGTVYELTPAGTETVIYTFQGGMDGAAPNGPLVMDAAGDLWGTTEEGGGSAACSSGCGAVFRLHKTRTGWMETVTYRFSGGADGAVPSALAYDRQHSAFYGVTNIGGSVSGCMYLGNATGCGTIFKLNAAGTKETVLHDFSGQADGGEPSANLVLDSRGDLYGTTTLGGDMSCPAGYAGCGTVFALSARGQFGTLHTFTGGTDGAVPLGALLVDQRDGALVGTASVGGDPNCQTQYGGGPGCGVVFRITP